MKGMNPKHSICQFFFIKSNQLHALDQDLKLIEIDIIDSTFFISPDCELLNHNASNILIGLKECIQTYNHSRFNQVNVV